MKPERPRPSRSPMQTDRLAIELNSSADPSKSTPHGDEGRFWGRLGHLFVREVTARSRRKRSFIDRQHIGRTGPIADLPLPDNPGSVRDRSYAPCYSNPARGLLDNHS